MLCGFLGLLWRRNYPMLTDASPRTKCRGQMSAIRGRMPRKSLSDIRNPKCLAIHVGSLQSTRGQLCFRQTQIGKVRQIAQHRLKPTVSGEKFAHAPVKKFIRVESQHGDVLRSSERGDRVKHRFRKVFAEKYSVLLQFQDCRHLLVRWHHAQGFGLWLSQPPGTNPMIQRWKESRVPEPHRVRV